MDTHGSKSFENFIRSENATLTCTLIANAVLLLSIASSVECKTQCRLQRTHKEHTALALLIAKGCSTEYAFSQLLCLWANELVYAAATCTLHSLLILQCKVAPVPL
jgi:hypothetical protein